MSDYEKTCADWVDTVYRPWYEAQNDDNAKGGSVTSATSGPHTGNPPPPPPETNP